MGNGPEEMRERKGLEAGTAAAGDAELIALEAELRGTLRQALLLPAGFAERVLQAAAVERAALRATVGQRRVVAFPGRLRERWRLVAGGAIAAGMLAGVFATEQVHQRRERERTEAAARQLETAMRVTSRALDQTRAQLARAGLRLEE